MATRVTRIVGAHVVVERVSLDWSAVPSAVQVALNPPKFPSFDTASAVSVRPPESSRSGSEG